MSVGKDLSRIVTMHETETGTLLVYHQNNHLGVFANKIRM